ncbi:MAG TPA: response regulator [Bryobacteraceae bacterium]|nr:response regulator [Bryobacteraceae bacterium]
MRKRVLVADDKESSRELVRTVLASQGYEVTEAADGRQALESIERERPDLVLLDLHMPELDGYTVVSRIRADPRLAGIPVVALTASAMSGDRERALEAGFSAYIAKPVSLSFLKAEVMRLIE